MTRLRGRLPPPETLLPLLAAYFLLATLYAWQAWRRETPTLFSDEIEFTQISRAIADTGHATLRGGEPAPGASLYAWVAAPAWWLDDVGSAYTAVKTLGVLLMTAAIFPAYALARLVVSRPWALFAAVATAAAPALSYSPFLVEEPLAYPTATLALWLIARTGLAPTRRSIALALAACVLAALVRGQLAVLFPVLGLVLAAWGWRTERQRRWRAGWTRGDWLGAAVLAVGGAVALSALVGSRSTTWYVATAFFKDRMLEYGLWAAGALAIGIGVLPLVAGLAALVRPRDEPPDARRDAFVSLAAAAIAAFGFYTAVKAAYLSTTLSIVIAERNLVYLYPVLFAGTALVLERRRSSLAALAAATAFAVYLVATTPYALAQYPNYEAHGLAIAAFANRILEWPDATIQTALLVVALASAAALAGLEVVRSRRGAAAAATASLAAFVLAWSLTTEIYAANGERRASDQVYANLPKPPDWIDRTTGTEPTIYVGQGIDAAAAWQTEFWNRSVRWFWGMDGSAPGPGERRTPNLLRPDGTQDPADLNAEYALAVNGVQVAAPEVTRVGGAVLYRLGGEPVRLTETTAGISPDGWMGADASYTRYVVDADVGSVKVVFSRQGACFPQLRPTRVSVRIGPVVVGDDDQPTLGRVTGRAEGELAACGVEPLVVPVPRQPWRVEAHVAETFVPNDLDPNQGDRRELGAVVGFERLSRYGG